MTRPLVVAGAEAWSEASDDLLVRGWRLTDGWDPAESTAGTVCRGVVAVPTDVARVVLAALSGAGVLACVETPSLVEQLGDDLRRLGPVENRFPDHGWVVLDDEERRLLDLLGEGVSLGEAARLLHLGRRTADRRLAAARARLGVSSNGAAIAVRRHRLAAIPSPP